jgi:SAM-dependent methyltransferase
MDGQSRSLVSRSAPVRLSGLHGNRVVMGIFEERSTRYEARWRDLFDEAISPFLRANVAVLDVGSGRSPTVGVSDRPTGCSYVGLDVSESELRLADQDAYDEIVVADVTTPDPTLASRFDLALSWQVFEHVRSLDRAFENIHSYLRPGGAVVAQLSGKFSAFALLNQLIPSRVATSLLACLLDRDPSTVFPAYYHHCYSSALERMLAGWSDVRIVPRFCGAGYFGFSRTSRRIYLKYEDWAMRSGHVNLATHYLIVAQK